MRISNNQNGQIMLSDLIIVRSGKGAPNDKKRKRKVEKVDSDYKNLKKNY